MPNPWFTIVAIQDSLRLSDLFGIQSEKVANQDDKSSVERKGADLSEALASTISVARQVGTTATVAGARALKTGVAVVRQTYRGLQNAAGENYHEILRFNPVLGEALRLEGGSPPSRADWLDRTLLNRSWTTTALWTAAAGLITEFQRPVGHGLGALFHYGPGHLSQWTEVHQYMDAVAGSGHRLKHGHSLDYLPDIVDRFGVEGVPAFIGHLLQDFTTVDGLPVLPNAWELKQCLQAMGLAPKTATALISLSASNLIAGLLIATAVWKLWTTWDAGRRKKALLRNAESAALNRDYTGAVESYKRALELERTPDVLMALGEVYLRRTSTRPYAHKAFADAFAQLGADPAKAMPHHGCQISMRGVAGLQALTTADAISEHYPQYWEERVENLVRGTIHSFRSLAEKLSVDAGSVLGSVGNPPLLSAAVNHYLAAQVACQYPLLDDGRELVHLHLTAAVGLVGRVAQTDETALRMPLTQIGTTWVRRTLPAPDADLLLATA